MFRRSNLHSIINISLTVLGLLVIAVPVLARDKYEAIDARYGHSNGAKHRDHPNIYEFSTPSDRQLLVQAYAEGQNQGLVNALQKMRAVGHAEITGTLGYDVASIKMTPTPPGRKIVFATNRSITFGEAWGGQPIGVL